MPASDYLVIRLYPTSPTDPATFLSSIIGLQITVYELSVTEPNGVSSTGSPNVIGTAVYYTPPATPPTPLNVIIQHDLPISSGGGPASVATAVIDRTQFEPPAYAEYQNSDLRLSITQNGVPLVDASLDYNVDFAAGVLLDPTNPATFSALTNISRYFAVLVPAAVASASPIATVNVPSDGSPPNFQELLTAVTTVLQADPLNGAGTVTNAMIANLTPAQCKHIAYEITWNRLSNPLPQALAAAGQSLELIYTGTTPSGSDPFPQQRQQFQAALATYYSTGNAEAGVLANYVYSLAAAFTAAATSQAATQVAFSFPVLPGATNPSGMVAQAEVILTA